MSRINDIVPQYVDTIPEKLEQGILYISKKYGTAAHLCACGCGEKTVTPLTDDDWKLTERDDKITLRPSIGNFMHERPNYHAHYLITDNKIEWL